MSYKIELRRSAQKNLDSLSDQEYKTIAEVISLLKYNPRPLKVKKLRGSDISLWRIRAGRFRIVYNIDDKLKVITIVRAAKRSEDMYKNL